uniref:U2A'/phosphoprotein 32 family A C-terminal domain-containing protein n=1 Tax=Globisporangium ultimum (strain ATCC 200006 / CBS 805.95 / DAOM BR144) TaxID=431595 RepID=K3X6H1_GLOUD
MHNSITSIPEVARLSHLRILKCSYNQIVDLSWVAQLQELRELWVHHNLIETPQIAHLQTLTQLQTLVLHPNPCTKLSSYMYWTW